MQFLPVTRGVIASFAQGARGTPYAWTTNQCGHVWIGAALATICGGWAVAPAISAAIVLAYRVGFEAIVQRSGDRNDMNADTFFLALGLFFAGPLWLPWALAACLIVGLEAGLSGPAETGGADERD